MALSRLNGGRLGNGLRRSGGRSGGGVCDGVACEADEAFGDLEFFVFGAQPLELEPEDPAGRGRGLRPQLRAAFAAHVSAYRESGGR